MHAYPDGQAPGLPRVQALGLDPVICPAPGTSEDIALLIADEQGASLIVAVGMHHTLVEFLDKGRSGMASTFLTRLRVDDKIVDAKGVSRLYQSRVSASAVIPLLLAAAVTIVVAATTLTAGQIFFRYLGTQLETFWYWLTGLFVVIDFRYHLVSIVAVFLALAIGIVVGASALKPEVLKVLDNASSSEQHQITSQRTTIRNQQNQLGSNEAFAQAAAPLLLDGLLADQRVALVTAPGADGPTINGITTALKLAGAKVTGQAQLQPAFFDTSAATQNSLEALAKQVAPPGLTLPDRVTGREVPDRRPAGGRAGARRRAGHQGRPRPARGRDQPDHQRFHAAGIPAAEPGHRIRAPPQATLAVVVIPASPPATDSDPANLALISVAEQLSLSSHGVVVAGSLTGSGPGSAIDELINGNTGAQLSSVNNADKEIGQIIVAQALSSLLAGHKPQAYGVGAAVPTPAPTPSPTPSGTPTAAAAPARRAAREPRRAPGRRGSADRRAGRDHGARRLRRAERPPAGRPPGLGQDQPPRRAGDPARGPGGRRGGRRGRADRARAARPQPGRDRGGRSGGRRVRRLRRPEGQRCPARVPRPSRGAGPRRGHQRHREASRDRRHRAGGRRAGRRPRHGAADPRTC